MFYYVLRRFFYKFSSIILLLVTSSFFIGCSSLSFQFPTYEFKAKSTVSVTELLKSLPVIQSIFDQINPTDFNTKLDKLAKSDIEVLTRMMFKLAILMREDPQFPYIVNQLAGPLKYFINYYLQADKQEEFKSAFQAGLSVLDVDPKSMRLITESLGDLVRSVSNDSNLFTIDRDSRFQGKPLWLSCYGSDFDSSKPQSLDGFREAYYGIYDALRLARCFYDGYDNVPAYSGAFIQQTLKLARDQVLIEVKVKNILNLLKDTNAIKDYETIATDWLAANPDKVAITDYLAKTGYSLLKKDFIFTEGKPLLDKEAAHLLTINPDYNRNAVNAYQNKYLFQWLLLSIYDDIDKLSHIADYVNIPTTPNLYKLGQKVIDSSIDGVANKVGLRSIFTLSNGSGQVSLNTMRDLLWNGKTFFGIQNNSVSQVTFKGLLFDDNTSSTANDGPLRNLLNFKSQDIRPKSYRQLMMSKLGSLVPISPTGNNESMFESIANNLYYHFLDNYYSISNKKWSLTASDGIKYFNNPERNFSNYITKMQYTLKNAVNLDSKGLPRTNPNADTIPFLTSILFTLGAANGTVDPQDAPGVLTLRKSLQAMRANVSEAGRRSIKVDLNLVPSSSGWHPTKDITDVSLLAGYVFDAALGTNFEPQVDVSLYCATGNCLGYKDIIFRNDKPFILTAGMKDFELVTPGLFYSRNGSSGSSLAPAPVLEGRFSPHQGDIYYQGEDNGRKTGEWVVNEFVFSSWSGYGPYTVAGKAPDGSKLKYKNDFYTDRYATALCDGSANTDNKYRASHSLAEMVCPQEWLKYNSMGENHGLSTEVDSSSIAKYSIGNNNRDSGGNYHFFEQIYRPMSANDPCWSDSLGSTYGYAKYGYLRPSNNIHYTDNTLCRQWEKVRVDFDSVDYAVRNNVNWLFYKKKYVFVIPIYGFAGLSLYGLKNEGASFSVFATIVANGVIGVSKANRVGPLRSDNGRWKLNSAINMMGSDQKGFIPSIPIGQNGLGLVREVYPQEGATITSRFGATSFTDADSTVVLETSIKQWGTIVTSVVDITKELFDTLGDGPVAPPLMGENIGSIEALVSLLYTEADVITSGFIKTSSNITKFQVFYDQYFPADDYSSTGIKGADGIPDLFQKYKRSLISPGCKDIQNRTVSFCLTALNLPPVPKVKGVRYPSSYDRYGAPVLSSFTTYDGLSDGKFSDLILPIVLSMGTLHSDGDIVKIDGTRVTREDNLDTVAIKYFDSNGFRGKIPDLLNLLLSLNETQKQSSSYKPLYNPQAMLNRLIETSPGARDGILPTLLNSKYLNFGDIDTIYAGVEELVSSTLKETLCQFTLTQSNGCSGSGSSQLSSLDKLQYYFSLSAVTRGFFDRNYLGDGGGSEEPLVVLKQFLTYLRSLTNDNDVLIAMKDGIKIFNSFLSTYGVTAQIPITEKHINILVAILNEQSSTGGYVLDNIIDLLLDSSLNNLYLYYDFRFTNLNGVSIDKLLILVEDIDKIFSKYFGIDYKKDLVTSQYMTGEPVCSNGSGFYDSNANGVRDPGFVSFLSTNTSVGTYTLTANTGEACSITVPIPDLYNFHSYTFNVKNILNVANRYVGTLNEEKLFSLDNNNKGLITKLHTLSTFDSVVTDVKNVVLDNTLLKVYDTSFTEFANDINKNGIIDDTEYFDINKNNTYDSITVRSSLEKLSVFYKDTFFKKNALGQPIRELNPITNSAIHTFDKILNPYNENCVGSNVEDCIYLTKKIYDAKLLLDKSLHISPQQLQDLKRVIGTFLYDAERKNYVYPITRIIDPTYKILYSFQGDYERLTDLMIRGLEKDGLIHYLLTTIKVPDQYSGIDLLQDVYTLLDNKNFREYGNDTTFWYQLSVLLESLANSIAVSNNLDPNIKNKIQSQASVNYYNIITDIK